MLTTNYSERSLRNSSEITGSSNASCAFHVLYSAYSRLASSNKTGGLCDIDRVGARSGRRIGGGDTSRVLAGPAGGGSGRCMRSNCWISSGNDNVIRLTKRCNREKTVGTHSIEAVR